MNKFTSVLFVLICLVFSSSIWAQGSISGTVKDTSGESLVGVNISLQPSGTFTVTDADGNFNLTDIKNGSYELIISFLGLKTYSENLIIENQEISRAIVLEKDLLNLQNVVVTGSFDPRLQLESSTAVSSLYADALSQNFIRGTAAVLEAIPGTFTDPSAGEVFTKVYARGISASAEDDLGWYYVSLQEDGLPVSLVQHSYYTPELFHRLDITTAKVEGIRGGSAAITALNAPGGIYNFISRRPSKVFGGEIQVQGGLQGESNPYYRTDIVFDGPIAKDWFFSIGGHYRVDEGARNTNFTFSKGGQLKMNLTKQHKNGYLKFYGKLLDDFTNRWTGVAATNWTDPKAAFGQNFNSTSLLMPSFNAAIPDGRRLADNATNDFDPAQGVHAQDRAFGVDFQQNLGDGWTLKNNIKYSYKNANWQTSISNNFVSLSNPLAYFITGAQFPIGQVVFRDAQTGAELSRVDNSGILAGEAFQYIGAGSLPNDAIMGTATWLKDNDAKEWMDQLSFRKQTEQHDLNFGIAGGFSNTSMFTQGSFGFVTYEPNPRMLRVTLENPGQPVLALSDENGVSNYGGLFFINSRAKVSQLAGFINDRWQLNDKINLDLGLRYESVKHNGSNDRFAPFSRAGGADGNPFTEYDNGVLTPTGQEDAFDFNYSYLSYSFGLNYKFEDTAALFARISKGNKAPELDYYFNNFSNVPVNQKGEIQRINQIELGLKWDLPSFSFTTTAFWSQLKNIGVGNFEFDGDTNAVFYTPIQFNASRTIGLEWESAYALTNTLSLSFNGTVQNPIATDWTIYNAAGSVPTDDDSIVDYSENQLPFNPKLMFNLGAEYQKDAFDAFLKWQFMGERQGNIANAFQLPSYSIFNAGVGYAISKNLTAHVIVTNLFNSAGLANFFGANSFGANANGATSEFIQANADASFVVVPVLPRGSMIKLSYTF